MTRSEQGPGTASAHDLGRRCAESITPELFAPIVKKLTDELYCTLMEAVQDYLVKNSAYNIAGRIEAADRAASTSRAELWEIDRILGPNSWEGTRAERIQAVINRATQADNLIYAVGNKHVGETRYETALRYIVEREQPANANEEGTLLSPQRESDRG